MPSKKRAKGYSASLFDLSYAQRLADEDAARLVETYGCSSAEALQEAFDHWAIFYRNNRAMREDGPTPSVVRDTASDIAAKAAKLAEELDGLDGATRNAIETTASIGEPGSETRQDIETLMAYGIATEPIGDHPITSLNLEPIASGVRVLAVEARRAADNIDAAIAKHGSKVTPRPYETSYSLMMLIIAIREFWERQGGRFTRRFEEFDEYGEPSASPINDCSRFTVEIVQAIDPSISKSQVRRAMQECIQHFPHAAKGGER